MNIAVTGSSSEIGRAIALKFLDEGNSVFGLDVRPGTIENENYRHFMADVRDESFPSCPDEMPWPDIIISSAGTIEEKDALEVNLKGAINFTEKYAVSPELKSVLYIASASARNGAEFPYYVASKAGLVGFMKNLALKLADRGITVNCISPGGVITRSNGHILDSPELYSAVKAETLLGKWAEPEEIADLAYFLTVVNRSMTGEDILIDNGEMLKSNFIW